MSKQCAACLEIYPFEYFYADRARLDGLMGRCIVCYKNKDKSVIRVPKKSMPILDKNRFYEWSLQDDRFSILYSNWVASGYKRKLTPSIDRINPKEGYLEGNIRWLTHSQNSARCSPLSQEISTTV